MGDSLYDHGVLDLFSSCPFCDQFSKGLPSPIVTATLGTEFNREVYHDDNCVVVPTLGQLVEGWLLVIPRQHLTSISAIPVAEQESFLDVVERTRRRIAEFYHPPVIFEHGSVLCSGAGGACIEHAHLHVVSGVVDLAPILQSEFVVSSLNGLEDLWLHPPEGDYLYYQASSGKALLIRPPEHLPCQYLRRLIAREIGRPNLWDWRTHLGTEAIRRVALTLQGTI